MLSGARKTKSAGLTKQEIRSKILLRLRTQKEEDRKHKSRIIKNKLFRTAIFRKAKTIMFYMSFDGEVDTQEMIEQAQKLGKKVAMPVCCKPERMIRPCLVNNLKKTYRGLYGIKEPIVKRYINLKHLDLVIVPGVAFDKAGMRLGRGKGYYDNFLARLNPHVHSIGLAYGFQILPRIPATATDIGVEKLIFA